MSAPSNRPHAGLSVALHNCSFPAANSWLQACCCFCWAPAVPPSSFPTPASHRPRALMRHAAFGSGFQRRTVCFQVPVLPEVQCLSFIKPEHQQELTITPLGDTGAALRYSYGNHTTLCWDETAAWYFFSPLLHIPGLYLS